jgi:hypothetical protein
MQNQRSIFLSGWVVRRARFTSYRPNGQTSDGRTYLVTIELPGGTKSVQALGTVDVSESVRRVSTLDTQKELAQMI